MIDTLQAAISSRDDVIRRVGIDHASTRLELGCLIVIH